MRTELKTKIREFYSPEVKFENELWLNTETGKRFVPKVNEPLYLTFGKETKNKEECVEVYPEELYREFSGFDPENFQKLYFGYSKRTQNFLDACWKNLGVVDFDSGWDPVLKKENIQYSLTDVYAGLMDSGNVECGRQDGNWIAEFSFRTDIDDYSIISISFNRKPTRKMVRDAMLIKKIRVDLQLGFMKEETRCWECGCTFHWLDIEGNLSEKWHALEECYCGC